MTGGGWGGGGPDSGPARAGRPDGRPADRPAEQINATTELTEPEGAGLVSTGPGSAAGSSPSALPMFLHGRFRSLLIGGISVVVAGLVAVGVLVLGDNDGPGAALAADLFDVGPPGQADGRELELNATAALGSTVVVAGGADTDSGYRAEFLVSEDAGRTFRRATARTTKSEPPSAGEVPRLLAASPGGWVAFSDRAGGTAVWTSPDGASWTRQPDATTGLAFGPRDRVEAVAWTGKGFTAVGQTSERGDFTDAAPVVWLSRDGLRWDRRSGWRLHPPTGGTLALTDVAALKGAIVVRGESSIKPYDITWRSTDGGQSWQAFAIPGSSREPALTLAATSSTMIALRRAGDHAEVYTSPDAQHWSTGRDLTVPGLREVLRLSGTSQAVVAAIGISGQVRLFRTTDGRSWRDAGSAPMGSDARFGDVTPVSDNVVLVGVDHDDELLAVRDKAGRAVPAKVPDAGRIGKVVTALGARDGSVVAVGGANGDAAIWTSSDGRSWDRAQGRGSAFTGPGRQGLTAVTDGPHGWLAVGYGGRGHRQPLVVSSADGTTWAKESDAKAFRGRDEPAAYGVASDGHGYVVVGEDGDSAAAWYSPDLRTWERGIPAGNDNLSGTPKVRRWMRSVAAGKFGYVASGGVTDPDAYGGVFTRRPTVWISRDGRKWALVRLPIPSGVNEGTLPYIAARGDTLVAAGTAVTGDGTGTGTLAYVSEDGGRSWQSIALPIEAGARSSVTAVIATPTGFVVAGTIDRPGDVVLWTSPDGRTWRRESPEGPGLTGPGDQRLTGFATVGDELVAVGSTTTDDGDRPTVWRRALRSGDGDAPQAGGGVATDTG